MAPCLDFRASWRVSIVLWLVQTDHVSRILASDWSRQITWPEYWPLIGPDLITHLWLVNIFSGDGGMGGMLYTAPLANVKLAEFRYGKYWPLIGRGRSRDLITGLWLVQTDHMCPEYWRLIGWFSGKEEILALFDKTREPPEELVNFGTLFVEKCQFPLSMMQVSLILWEKYCRRKKKQASSSKTSF